MWLIQTRDAAPLRFSAYRFALARVLFGFVVLLVLAWMPRTATVPFEALRAEWDAFPVAWRGGVRLLGCVAALAVTLGWQRRVAGAVVFLVLAVLGAVGQLEVVLAAALGALALSVAAFPAGEPFALGRGQVEPLSPSAPWLWYRVTWLLAVVGMCVAPMIAGAIEVQGASLLAMGLAGVVLWRGPARGWVLAFWAVSLLGLVVLFAEPWSLLPFCLFLLVTFDEAWFPARVEPDSVVFFDGECVLCNGAVQLIMAEEATPGLLFASLQGETALVRLAAADRDLDTIVLSVGDQRFRRSNAALGIARAMGGFWAGIAWFSWVPVRLRDALYDVIARHRYQWFGKLDACPLPKPEQRSRYLP